MLTHIEKQIVGNNENDVSSTEITDSAPSESPITEKMQQETDLRIP